MATATISANNFTLTSKWTNGGSSSEESTTLSFAYSLPAAAVISSVTFTLTTGNPNTGIYYVRANDVDMGNYFNTPYTKTLTTPSAISGTYNVTVKYRANGNSGTGSGACAFTNIYLTINYTINSFSIITVVSPEGAGTLTASETSAAPGTTITLTATPATGYYLSSYNNNQSVAISNNAFTMPSGAITVTANFAKINYTVTAAVNPSGGGSLTLSKTSATMGDTVTLTATPATGYQFSSYSNTGGTISGNTLTMPAGNVTVTANFTMVSYTVTAAVSPSGGGTLTLSKSSATMGDTVTLTANASTGYKFSKYTTTGGTISGNTLTMPAGNVTVTATFTKISYTVTAAVSPSGGGTLTLSKSSATMGDTVTLTAKASTGYQFSSYTKTGGTISGNTLTMPAGNVTVTANFTKISYTVTAAVSPSGGGTLTLSKTSATMGDTVTLTAKASTGYQFSSYTKTGGTISGNTLTMPAGNVTVTANFTKISYTITKASSPSGAGTVTTNPASSATMGTSVAVSQTPAAGYYFNGWQTSPSVTISNGAFTMPAGNITVTAKYLKRSTASLNATSMTGGASVVLTITTESTAYKHKYKLSFGSGMETAETEVAAGTTSVMISVPASWSSGITNATSKTGGTLVLTTISGSTTIGTYTITGLTYNVPASAIPTIGTISTSILRTVGGTTYANVGNYYVQRHSGVSISTTGSGVYGSTIASMKITMSGYSGTGYTATSTSGSISLSSGLLTNSGTTTITVTATDSRGRTATRTATITVTAYQKPTATLDVWRVNSGGSTDPLGTYAKYSITRSFTSVGSNALEYTRITSQGSTANVSATTGDILPGSRQTFNIQLEYNITFAVKDAFETTTVTAKLPTGRFIIFASADGSRLGFMRATSSRTIPSGKNHIVEFSGDSQIYIGDETLEAYIRRIASS